MPGESTIQQIKIKNVIGSISDLPKLNPRASLVSRVRSILLKMFGTPKLIHQYGTFEPNKTLTLNGGDNNIHVVFSDGTYLYAGLNTSPGKVVKIDLQTFTVISTLTLDTGEDYVRTLVSDGTYLYAGMYASVPSKVVKVDLQTFTKVGTLTFDTGENGLWSLCIDGTYLYGGLHLTSPAKVVRINLSTFTKVDTLSLTGNSARSLYYDGSYLYAGLYLSDPSQISKIDLSTFTEVSILSLNTGESNISSLFSDGIYLYGCLDQSPSKIVKIDLQSFTEVGVLTFDSGEDYFTNAFFDGTYTHVVSATTPGKLIKIDMLTFTKILTEQFSAGENMGYGIFSDGTYLYIGLLTSPGKILRRYIMPTSNVNDRKIDLIDEQLHSSNYYMYPSLASGVTLTSGAGAWTPGNYSEVVPADTIATTFYITNITLSNMTANVEYEVHLATGAAASESIISKTIHKVDSVNLLSHHAFGVPIKVSSRTRVSTKCADDIGSNTCKIKVRYKT